MRFVLLLVSLGALGVLGCGVPDPAAVRPPLVPVHGKVLRQGKPVEGVVVEFHPLFDIGPVKYTPAGTTAADGTFAVNYGGPAGAPVGEYAVTFAHMVPTDPGDAGSAVDRWKGKYSDSKKSKFKVTIKDGQNELEPFKLD